RWTTIALGVGAALILALPGLYVWSLVTPPTLGVGGLGAIVQEYEAQEEQQRKTWHELLENAPAAQVWDPSMAVAAANPPQALVPQITDNPRTRGHRQSDRNPI